MQLPVYYSWQFNTGPSGDFASLVKLLHAYTFPADSGARLMFVGAAGPGLPVAAEGSPQATVGFASALLPAGADPADWTGTFADGFRAALLKMIDVPVDSAADPLVTPTFYAGRHANQPKPPAPGAVPLWLGDLNLNPQHRAVAAYGTRVVQNEQEALMASAWDQAGDMARANSMLRQAQLLRRASEAVYTNHVSKLASGTLLEITRPVHTRTAVAANTNAAQAVLPDTHFPAAIVSRAYRTVARSSGPMMRTVLAPPQRIARTVVTRVASGTLVVSAALPTYSVATPEGVEASVRSTLGGWNAPVAGAIAVSFLGMQVNAAASFPQRPAFVFSAPELPGVTVNAPRRTIPLGKDSLEATNFRAAVAAHQALVGPAIMIFAPLIPAVNIDQWKPAVLAQINPTMAIAHWVGPLIQVNGATPTNDTLDQVAAAPQFPQPMYEALSDISRDLMIADINDLPDNTVSLLKPNPRFVEAFLAGLNQEMARELLWRGYPTDQRGTYFRNFWDRRGVSPAASAVTDIPAINTWPPQKHLGEIAAGAGDSLVLLIRGEITRRYPNAIVYMVQATWPAGNARPSLGTAEMQPVMRGTLQPDMMFFGFPVAPKDAVGTGNSAQPGWFFVIQEHPCAPRFGVEPDAAAGPLRPGANSAATAQTYLQPPVRMAIHAADLLAGT